MSPDHNALVGAAAEPAGVVYATGFSGHGFQQGPVIGEHLAQRFGVRHVFIDVPNPI